MVENGDEFSGLTMINQAELKVAAVIGALLGIVTGYLVGGEWFIMLIWALIGAVVVSGMVYCLRLSVKCPSLADFRHHVGLAGIGLLHDPLSAVS